MRKSEKHVYDIAAQVMLDVSIRCNAHGISTAQLLPALMQQCAMLVAASRMSGEVIDMKDLLAKFEREVSLSTQAIMAKVN